MDKTTIIFIVILVAVFGFGVYSIIASKKPKKGESKAKVENTIKLYNKLGSNFITSGKLKRITTMINGLAVYSRYEVQKLSAKYCIMSYIILVGVSLAGFILFKDSVSKLLCVALAYVMSNIVIEKQVDKAYMRVYTQLRVALSSVRQEYLRLGSVAEAILEANFPDLMQKPFDQIYQILISNESEVKLQEFYEVVPFRPLQTIAGVCYSIHNDGDTKDANGHSNFVQALTLMASDVTDDLARLRYRKARFGFIEYLPLIPVALIKPIEYWFSDIMPGTVMIYNGPAGFMIKALIIIVSIITYTVIARMNTVLAFSEDDRSPAMCRLLENKKISKIVSNMIPKNKSRVRVIGQLKEALSKKTLEEFYVSKFVMAVTAFMMALLIMYSSVNIGYAYVSQSTQQLALVPSNEMDAYSPESIRELDNKYIQSGGNMDREELKSNIRSHMPGLTDLQVEDQMKRIQDKYNYMEMAKFQWWFVIACMGISVLCWFGPNIQLRTRKYLVMQEEEDDFLQLQTLTTIIMNTNCDTLEAIGQLANNSRIHKEMLAACYHSYPSDPRMAIARLNSKTNIIEFRRFISKLELTIDDLSLQDAFSDLVLERDYVKDMRELTMRNNIEKRRNLCGQLSKLSIGLMVTGEILIPLGYLGVMQFMGSLAAMSS